MHQGNYSRKIRLTKQIQGVKSFKTSSAGKVYINESMCMSVLVLALAVLAPVLALALVLVSVLAFVFVQGACA